MSAARDVARRVLARVAEGQAYATLALDGELGRAGLDERDRRLVAELVYGTLRQEARLDRALAAFADLGRTPPAVRRALRMAAYQLLHLRVPAHAAVDDAVGAVRAQGGGKLAGFANAVLRKLAARGEPALPTEPRARAEVVGSLPRWIVDELAAQLPAEELEAAAAALAQPAALWLRVNPTRATRDEVAAELTAAGATVTTSPLAPQALAVRGLGEPTASPGFAAGRWTVQDLAAQLVGAVAAPAAGARVLDACAGVGGKTTHLAELAWAAASAGATGDLAGPAGSAGPAPLTIDAVDPAATKLGHLRTTAARLGLSGIRTIVGTLERAAAEATYDLVVVDAPCSGLGVVRRHPEAKTRITAAAVAGLAAAQAALLDQAAARVAPGGVLIYAVCTFTRAEGPDQVAAFVGRHPAFAVEPPPLPAEVAGVVVEGGAVRTWPHRHDADGFFLARLRRR